MPHPEWISKLSFCFPIASEYFGPARVHIMPRGYEKDKNGTFAPDCPNKVYGIYLAACFEDDGRGLKYEINDFVEPKCLYILEEFLGDSEGQHSSVSLLGENGYLEISFHRNEKGRLKISCNSPSLRYKVNCLRLQLEGFIDEDSLAEPHAQVRELLEMVRKIDSGEIES